MPVSSLALTVPDVAGVVGAWVASSFTALTGFEPGALSAGDVVDVYGSPSGTPGSIANAQLIATVVVDASLKVYVSSGQFAETALPSTPVVWANLATVRRAGTSVGLTLTVEGYDANSAVAVIPGALTVNQGNSNASPAQAWTVTGVNGGIAISFATEPTLAALRTQLPASLGSHLSAASLSITPASDALFPVTQSTSPWIVGGTLGALATEATLGNVNTGVAANGVTLGSILANQTNGTQLSIVRGGAKGATTVGTVTSTSGSVNRQALDVSLYDGSGNIIGSGGAGTALTVTGTVAATQSTSPWITRDNGVQYKAAGATIPIAGTQLAIGANQIRSIEIVNQSGATIIFGIYDAVAQPGAGDAAVFERSVANSTLVSAFGRFTFTNGVRVVVQTALGPYAAVAGNTASITWSINMDN